MIRISPTELAFNTPGIFRDIYGARPGGCFQKDPSRYLAPANGVNHLVGEIDNGSHARQRKLLAPAFSDRSLREQEPILTGYVDTMISKLRAEIQKGSPVLDIKNWMNYTTFDITGDLMFGESFGCLKDNQLHPWIDLIFKSIKALAYDGTAQQFPVFHRFLSALILCTIGFANDCQYCFFCYLLMAIDSSSLDRPGAMCGCSDWAVLSFRSRRGEWKLQFALGRPNAPSFCRKCRKQSYCKALVRHTDGDKESMPHTTILGRWRWSRICCQAPSRLQGGSRLERLYWADTAPVGSC
jgi:hypothetical protein